MWPNLAFGEAYAFGLVAIASAMAAVMVFGTARDVAKERKERREQQAERERLRSEPGRVRCD